MTGRILDRAALATALISLLVLGLRPSSTAQFLRGTAVVRTPGATGGDAKAVADSFGVAELDLHDLAALRRTSELHVVGWGLDGEELRRVGDRPIVLHPRPLPDGITEIDYPTSIALGEEVRIALTISAGRRGRVVLEAPTGAVDSAMIAPGRDAEVILHHRPAAVGATRYVVRAGGIADTFSVQVMTAYAPTALLLGAAPSRDLSDLRDWLARQGGSVILRTPISRDRSRLERVNTGNAATPLSASALSRTGVIITDGRGLRALSSGERRAVRVAVEGGLGLIVTLDDLARDPQGWSPEERRAFFPWTVTATEGLDERQVRPRIAQRPLSATPVEAEGAVIGALPFGAMAELDDGQGGTLAAVSLLGRGRVVGSLVTGTGRWLRGGESAAYGAYWQHLVRAAARPDPREEWIGVGPGPVIVDRELMLARPTTAGREGVIAGDTVHFTPDPLAPERSVAHWWPRTLGWNEMGEVRIWVSGHEGWQTWQGAERHRLTLARVSASKAGAEAGITTGARVPWPLWPFFVLFVLSAGWCWRKVSLKK